MIYRQVRGQENENKHMVVVQRGVFYPTKIKRVGKRMKSRKSLKSPSTDLLRKLIREEMASHLGHRRGSASRTENTGWWGETSQCKSDSECWGLFGPMNSSATPSKKGKRSFATGSMEDWLAPLDGPRSKKRK